MSGDSKAIDEQTVTHRSRITPPKLLETYKNRYALNADETDIFLLLLDKSLVLKNDNC